jgi:hypothetical protein
MTMTASGVAKLIEECGELTQILGKKLAYWHTDDHPDGQGLISERIMEEMGDVRAALDFVAEQLGLSSVIIDARRRSKLNTFRGWHAEIDNNDLAIDRPLAGGALQAGEPYRRVAGDMICETCHKPYWKHGRELRTLESSEETYLVRLCDGTLGKT